jgi:acetyl esterase/lipase
MARVGCHAADYKIHRDLVKTAALQPKYDYANPVLVRKKMNRNIAISEKAGFWMRQDAAVEWWDGTIPNSPILVRIYRPKKWNAPGPAAVYLHGGGFVVGDLNTEHPRCLAMCKETNAMVVSVAYRLAPEHPFPAGFDDCYEAVEWIMNCGAIWQIDTSRIAIVGCSAGGCLAAAIMLKRRDNAALMPQLQLLIYPVLDDRMSTRSMLSGRNTPVWDYASSIEMWQHYLGPLTKRGAVSCYAAPARAQSFSGLPRSYIVTAEHDPLRDEALIYARQLLDADVSTEIHQFSGAFHGFDTLSEKALSRRACAEQYAVLRDALAIED